MKREYWIVWIAWMMILSGCGLFHRSLPSGQVPNPSPNDHFIKVAGVNYHYTEYPGDGANVVLLHGFAASTYTWEAMAKMLNQKGYHVWAMDLKGFGWSDKPLDADYSAVALMEDVNGWMAAVGLTETVFVGNSLGGAIAVLLSDAHPERISKMVLIDAGGYPFDPPTAIKLAQLPLSTFFAEMIFGPWMIRHNLKQVFHNKELVTDERVREYFQRTNSQNGVATLIRTGRSVDFSEENPIVHAAADNTTPTLIIWGEADQWIPLDVGRRFENEMSNAVLTVIPQCGHIPQEEKPEETARLILDFIMEP